MKKIVSTNPPAAIGFGLAILALGTALFFRRRTAANDTGAAFSDEDRRAA